MKTTQNNDWSWLFIPGFIIGLALGLFTGYKLTKDDYQKSAIEANVAQYNPTNATFEYKSLK